MKISEIKKLLLASKKHRQMSIWGMSILFFILLYVLQISSVRDALNKYEAEETNLKAQFTAAMNKQKLAETTLADFNQIKKEYQLWDNKIANSPPILDQINEILKIAAKNNLVFNNFDPQDGVEAGDYYKVPIDVNISSDYHSFARFVSEIANLPSIIVVSNYTININPKASENKNLTTDLYLEVYTKPEADTHAEK